MQKACPKCTHELTSVARGAYKCPNCAGMFVPAQIVPFMTEAAGQSGAADHDPQVGQCPVDRTILIRAQVDLGPDNPPIHLERCGSCRGIWFDGGEWSLLADRQLLDNVDQFWTAEWRASQRRQQNEREYDRRQREELGPELYDELQSVAAKLKGNARRSQALAFLREASAE